MDLIQSIISGKSSEAGSLFANQGDGQAFGQVFGQALKDAGTKVRESVLNKNKLFTSASQDNAFSFKKGFRSASDVAEAIDLTRAGLPSSYKKQIGQGLVVMGRDGSSENSMLAGANLMDVRSSGEALKGIFDSLGAERPFLKLGSEAIPALGQVLADSGLDDESINKFVAELAAGDMTLDQVYYSLSKLDLSGQNSFSGLIATEEGLPALGQFFGSLGASPEIVNAITSAFTNGEPVTASALRQIIGSGDDGFLAPCLSEADLDNLAGMLRSMGVSQDKLNSLSNLLTQSKGQMSTNDFLNFIEGLENAPAKPVTGSEMDLVKTILQNITREQELVKTPVFDEILTKMQMLGDQEIDDDFMKLSPAMQALRGGLSAMNQQAAFGGQGGQQGQNQRRDEREEQYRQALNTANSESTPAAAIETTETVQSYGGQESLARQISQKMLYTNRRGLRRLKMKLNPQNMGQVDIELKVKGDQLVAHIRADNREAYQALAGEIDSLKTALAEGGLDVSNLTLSYDDQATGQTEFADLRDLKARAEESRDEEAETRRARSAEAHEGSVSRMI